MGWFVGDAPDFGLITSVVNRIRGKTVVLSSPKQGSFSCFNLKTQDCWSGYLNMGPGV